MGNLGGDPELHHIQGGDAVLRLRVATTERYQDRDGNWQDAAEWHDCAVWGNRAEALADILSKGDKVMIEGKLQTRSYDREGVTHYRTSIKVLNLEFANVKGNGEQRQGGGQRGGGHQRQGGGGQRQGGGQRRNGGNYQQQSSGDCPI